LTTGCRRLGSARIPPVAERELARSLTASRSRRGASAGHRTWSRSAGTTNHRRHLLARNQLHLPGLRVVPLNQCVAIAGARLVGQSLTSSAGVRERIGVDEPCLRASLNRRRPRQKLLDLLETLVGGSHMPKKPPTNAGRIRGQGCKLRRRYSRREGPLGLRQSKELAHSRYNILAGRVGVRQQALERLAQIVETLLAKGGLRLLDLQRPLFKRSRLSQSLRSEEPGQGVTSDGGPESFGIDLAGLRVHRALKSAANGLLRPEGLVLPAVLSQPIGDANDLTQLRERIGLCSGRGREASSDGAVDSAGHALVSLARGRSGRRVRPAVSAQQLVGQVGVRPASQSG